MQLAAVSLDDKYERREGRIHITGSQALVRLAMVQCIRDRAAGLDTACYVTGYRGSPMHNIDKELWSAKRFLAGSHIHFQPAVNEDLAATAIWGSQQAAAFGDCRHDGVFSLWYGKGPGLDRSMDAIRHGHMAGSARHGGVLVMVGDDHALTSTDAPAVHEFAFVELMMPFLYPSTVHEVLRYGLHGIALSRYCGAWVGYKAVPDTVDASAPLEADPFDPAIVLPDDFEMPPDGLNLRIPDFWYQMEPRHRDWKLDAAVAYARANGLNRVTVPSRRPRYGIVATGKAWNDVRQALFDLGIDDRTADEIGITVLKVAMPYPFDAETVRGFADGLEELFVVEEKVALSELQIRNALYPLPDGRRPRVIGQKDEAGRVLLPGFPEITPEDVARALAARIAHFHTSRAIDERIAFLDAKARQARARQALEVARTPYFCSGCPHNTSTRVPEGSRAQGGVGCHFMATYMDRGNVTHTHMGGEGANWMGQAPFVETGHVFQNLGDGTYYHSGLLAIRACVAAGVNVTFKILFNDAVAMTGGQPHDGPIDPPAISHQVRGEGVETIRLVSDEPEKYGSAARFARGTRLAHRRELDRVQRELRETPGVSVLIYDQTCAAEKRRRRKRGAMVDPDRRAFIHHRVCEGCGDCNAKSNCLSVLPLDTEYGRKRQIDQSACNKDFSCVEGFCPSFVTVQGAKPRRGGARVEVPAGLAALPEPDRPRLDGGRPFSLLVAGVGGTGVVTIGALVTMAAHLEGIAFSTVDQFGMAQKGGAVTSHVRIAARPEDMRAIRLNAGAADLVLGCDSLVASGDLALNVMDPRRTRVIVNTHEQITGQFTRHPDLRFPTDSIVERIRVAAGKDNVQLLDATRIATRLLGDAIASNLFLLGFAYQRGLVPVSGVAIERAIELNAVAVEMNREAFRWGRRAARDLPAVERLALEGDDRLEPPAPKSTAEFVERRVADLTEWQNAAWAARYRGLVERVRAAERALGGHAAGARRPEAAVAAGEEAGGPFTDAVARYAYKLMAYKDEYEVARLYADGSFRRRLAARFEGDLEVTFHLAPPLLSRPDPVTGEPRKRAFGAWMWPVFGLLAKMRGLRGTAFDPFGRTAERRMERRLIEEYFETIEELIAGLRPENHALAVEIASVPDRIRGFGHVKQRNAAEAEAEKAALLERWRAGAAAPSAADRAAA